VTQYSFEPIRLNESAPGGAYVLRSFEEVTAFALIRVHANRRNLQWWVVLRKELRNVYAGTRHAEAYAAARRALAEEGWLSN
jgi:hypothetical protein